MSRASDHQFQWMHADDADPLRDRRVIHVWVLRNGKWVMVYPWHVYTDEPYRLAPPELEQEDA